MSIDQKINIRCTLFVFLTYSSDRNSLDVSDGSRMNIRHYGYRLLEHSHSVSS